MSDATEQEHAIADAPAACPMTGEPHRWGGGRAKNECDDCDAPRPEDTASAIDPEVELAQFLLQQERPPRDMIIWWNIIRPDRIAIADTLSQLARDYERGDCHEAGRALRDAARWVRASAGDTNA